RAREVDKLVARLPKRPASVALELKSTRAGVERLLEGWGVLSVGLDAKGGWTMQEVHTACDLMGIRPEDRAHSPKITIADLDSARAMLEREVGQLKVLLAEGLEEQDEQRRQLAALGEGLEDMPAMKLVRRYLRDAYRGLDQATKKFEDARPGGPLGGPGTPRAQASPAAGAPEGPAPGPAP